MTLGRCLVLGGSGFMGSHVVELLANRGWEVRGFSQSQSADRWRSAAASNVTWVTGDFRDPKAVAGAVEGCDHVYHLVGATNPASSNRDVIFDTETNLIPTLRLLEACVRAKVRRIVFSSSGGTVYGPTNCCPISEEHPTEPRSSYGIVKLATEKYLALFHHLHGLDYTVLRVANCYGPRLPVTGEQGVVGSFLDRLNRGEPIEIWGDGAVTRDYVYVGDVAQAFLVALDQPSPFKVFNVGTGIGTSLLELLALMERVTGRRAAVVKKPRRPVDVPVNILDPTRARQFLGWEAGTSLEAGLLQTWNWVRAARGVVARAPSHA
jgi:UDP-glucose 4-epimerase